MKAMVCEMCQSNDLIKQDGMYVCQYCGMKYAPEEAKKLLVEVSGTVKVDNSDAIEKYFELARQSRHDNNSSDAAKYYSLIKESNPTNWEAYFYSTYYHAMDCRIGEISSAIASISNIADNTLKYVKKNIEDTSEQIKVWKEVVIHVQLACNSMFEVAKNHYCEHNEASSAWSSFCNMKNSIEMCLLAYYGQSDTFFVNNVDKKFSNLLLKDIVQINIQQYNLHPSPDKDMYDSTLNMVNTFADEIKKNEPEYEAPSFTNRNTGGCYVATAVYGSYDCPEVWTLRRFRDNTLAETWYGRTFIRIYYATSPTLVKLFGETEWFKKLWKGKLDRMVKNLNENGVEDTPYNDRKW